MKKNLARLISLEQWERDHGSHEIATGKLFTTGPLVSVCVPCQQIAIHPRQKSLRELG